jgi:hypothetical protein
MVAFAQRKLMVALISLPLHMSPRSNLWNEEGDMSWQQRNERARNCDMNSTHLSAKTPIEPLSMKLRRRPMLTAPPTCERQP